MWLGTWGPLIFSAQTKTTQDESHAIAAFKQQLGIHVKEAWPDPQP